MDPVLFVIGLITIFVGIALLFASLSFKQTRSRGVAVLLLGPFPIVIGSRSLLFLLAPALLLILVLLLVL